MNTPRAYGRPRRNREWKGYAPIKGFLYYENLMTVYKLQINAWVGMAMAIAVTAAGRSNSSDQFLHHNKP